MATRREQIAETLAAAFNAGRGLGVSMASDVCGGNVITTMEEGNEDATVDQFRMVTATFTITVGRLVEADEASATQATELLGQLITEIPEDESLGGLCDWCRYSLGGIVPRGEGSALAGARLDLAIQYRFDIDDPSILTE